MNPKNIRNDFHALDTSVNDHNLTYLDSAATTLTPQQVIQTTSQTLQRSGNPGRSTHTISEETNTLVKKSRENIASLTNTKSEEIVFTHNTTDSINQLAQSLLHDNVKGKNIVTTAADHHANYLPWKQAAEHKNIEHRIVETTKDGKIDINDMERKIDEHTHVFAFPHACNVTGTIFNVKKLLKNSKKATYTVLDAAQSIPHLPVNLQQLNVDFAAFSPHKMLGIGGLGVLYGKEHHLATLEPARTGGGMVADASAPTYRDTPTRHEAGTLPVASIAACNKAVDYLKSLSMKNVHKHTRSLAETAYKQLKTVDNVTTVGSKPSTGIVSFTVHGIHSHDIASYLDQQGIEVRAGQHCSQPLFTSLETDDTVRLSFYIYNTQDEVEHVITKIKEAIKVLPHV